MDCFADVSHMSVTFPYRYNHAVMLIAECLADCFCTGELLTEFIFTAADLSNLLADQQNLLDPKDDLYSSWEESDYFDDWQSHVKMLCESLKKQIATS